MTTAEKLFLAIIKTGDVESMGKIKTDWIDVKEMKQYRYILDHFKTVGVLPPETDFIDKFDIEPTRIVSKPVMYLKELRERYVFTSLAENIPGIMSGVKKGAVKALDQLRELIGNLEVEDHEARDMRYDAVDSRLADYTRRKLTKGVTHLSAGLDVLDKYWYGYGKADLITIAGRAGLGKCLGKGTEVMMHDFSLKKVEDIVTGDKLMGPDGKERNVLSTVIGTEQMYIIKQKHGKTYRVNESHILSLRVPTIKSIRKTVDGKRVYLGSETTWETVNISVKEYLTKSAKWRKHAKGYKSYGMEFPHRDVPIDPYFLGVWLGDGHSRELCITTTDQEIHDYCSEYAKSFGGEFTQQNDPIVYRMKGCIRLGEMFKKNNLTKSRYNTKSTGHKHIPVDYLKNSRDVRLQLLAGLIDSDGSISTPNTYEITLKLEHLIDQIALLCGSLGFKTSKRRRRIKGGVYYRLSISGDTDQIPVKLERKKAQPRSEFKHHLHTGIQVVPDKVDNYYGFSIDGDRLFCLSDFTVTHNTWMLIFLALKLADTLTEDQGDVLFISNEMPEDEIADRFDAVKFKLPYSKFLKGELSRVFEAKYRKGLERLKTKGSKITFVYNCNTLEMLRAKIDLYKPSAVFIDGSYLMLSKRNNELEKIMEITRGLKRTAKDTGTPIINTTQLRKGTGKSKASALDGQDELAYGGSYIQDSDLVLRMFQNTDMVYENIIGLDHVKGRRLPPNLTLYLKLNLDGDGIQITEDEDSSPEDDEMPPPAPTAIY